MQRAIDLHIITKEIISEQLDEIIIDADRTASEPSSSTNKRRFKNRSTKMKNFPHISFMDKTQNKI